MQVSFFDYAMKDKGGVKTQKFLNEMSEIIPFDTIEKILIDKGIYKPNKTSRGDFCFCKKVSVKGIIGRPSVPSKILVGTMFLQSWYGLSDPMAEELIHDRISFRKFLDIKDEDNIPDETTICKFRKKLVDHNLFETIFIEVKNMMNEKNLILNTGTLVDATLIHSSEPKRKRDKDGKVISNKAYDKEATYTSKRGRKHHGHKMHIATDRNGIIKEIIATTAKLAVAIFACKKVSVKKSR